MAKPRVFLGSSGKSYALITWLAQRLRQDDIAIPVEWRVDAFSPGQSTLAGLIEDCRKDDLAVIFLTKDDYLQKDYPPNIGGEGQIYVPRDNCIFEAGLFVGALGLDPRRCVLVSSVDQQALPSDLLGLTVIPMPSPAPGEVVDEAWCNSSLQQVFARVKAQIVELKSFLLRPLLPVFTKDQLSELERTGLGDLKRGESVVVNSSEPVERENLKFAIGVVANVFERVRYHYFFRGSAIGAFRWIELLRTLVLACVAREHKDILIKPLQEHEIAKLLDSYQQDALKGIKQLQVWLRIHLLAHSQRMPLRICVHNAQSEEDAKCYLRHVSGSADYFIHLCSGQRAKDIVEELLELGSTPSGASIFCTTRRFDLYSNDETSEGALTRQAINEEIERLFPKSLQKPLTEACLAPIKEKGAA